MKCVVLHHNSKYPGHREYDIQYNSTYPDADYPDRLGLSGKFVENSTKLNFLEITVIGSSTVQCYSF